MNKHRTCRNQWLRALHLRGKQIFQQNCFYKMLQIGMWSLSWNGWSGCVSQLCREAAICFFPSLLFLLFSTFKVKVLPENFIFSRTCKLPLLWVMHLFLIHSVNTLIDFHWLGIRIHQLRHFLFKKKKTPKSCFCITLQLKNIFKG